MATFNNPARRAALAGGFALAIAAAPMVAAFAVPSSGPAIPSVAECAPGETVDAATGECMPAMAPQPGGDIGQSTPGDPNSLPEVNGVPCTGANTGTCIGLQEVQPAPAPEPSSTISSSP